MPHHDASRFDAFARRSSLTRQQEIDLLARVEAGSTWNRLPTGVAPEPGMDGTVELTDDAREARDTLVAENARLAAHIMSRQNIWRRVKSEAEREDLLQEAALGLQMAIERFRAAHDRGLTAPASWWIKSRASAWAIKNGYSKRHNVNGQDRIPPSRLGSLEAPLAGAGDGTDAKKSALAEVVPEEKPTALEAMAENEPRVLFRAAVAKVATMGAREAREMEALSDTLGLETGFPQRLDAVAARFGISKEGARQLRERGLARVLAVLKGHEPTSEEVRAALKAAEFSRIPRKAVTQPKALGGADKA